MVYSSRHGRAAVIDFVPKIRHRGVVHDNARRANEAIERVRIREVREVRGRGEREGEVTRQIRER